MQNPLPSGSHINSREKTQSVNLVNSISINDGSRFLLHGRPSPVYQRPFYYPTFARCPPLVTRGHPVEMASVGNPEAPTRREKCSVQVRGVPVVFGQFACSELYRNLMHTPWYEGASLISHFPRDHGTSGTRRVPDRTAFGMSKGSLPRELSTRYVPAGPIAAIVSSTSSEDSHEAGPICSASENEVALESETIRPESEIAVSSEEASPSQVISEIAISSEEASPSQTTSEIAISSEEASLSQPISEVTISSEQTDPSQETMEITVSSSVQMMETNLGAIQESSHEGMLEEASLQRREKLREASQIETAQRNLVLSAKTTTLHLQEEDVFGETDSRARVNIVVHCGDVEGGVDISGPDPVDDANHAREGSEERPSSSDVSPLLSGYESEDASDGDPCIVDVSSNVSELDASEGGPEEPSRRVDHFSSRMAELERLNPPILLSELLESPEIIEPDFESNCVINWRRVLNLLGDRIESDAEWETSWFSPILILGEEFKVPDVVLNRLVSAMVAPFRYTLTGGCLRIPKYGIMFAGDAWKLFRLALKTPQFSFLMHKATAKFLRYFFKIRSHEVLPVQGHSLQCAGRHRRCHPFRGAHGFCGRCGGHLTAENGWHRCYTCGLNLLPHWSTQPLRQWYSALSNVPIEATKEADRVDLSVFQLLVREVDAICALLTLWLFLMLPGSDAVFKTLSRVDSSCNCCGMDVWLMEKCSYCASSFECHKFQLNSTRFAELAREFRWLQRSTRAASRNHRPSRKKRVRTVFNSPSDDSEDSTFCPDLEVSDDDLEVDTSSEEPTSRYKLRRRRSSVIVVADDDKTESDASFGSY